MATLASNIPSYILILSIILIFHLNLTYARNGGNSDMNVIDQCWRTKPTWWKNREELATCSVGFAGKMENNIGNGLTHYIVIDPSDDPINPKVGTLRYATTKLTGKVWITFQMDMHINLERPLLVSSFTTIDGRGSRVYIARGACFLLHQVTNVIIHGLIFHHCRAQDPGPVMGPGSKVVQLGHVDGDAIRLIGSSKVWIDHNTLYRCQDGLLDVTKGSTDITVSNNWFRRHDKVMLLGHDDSFVQDRNMRVTVIFNVFGPDCNQRMPRVRHGYAHIANNHYLGWGDYAIGGSMNPSVRSESNLFIAPNSSNKKVTWKQTIKGASSWSSVNDMFVNGAYFKRIGNGGGNHGEEPHYNRHQRFQVADVSVVRLYTRTSGALRCYSRSRC